jgi:hypothetical protein
VLDDLRPGRVELLGRRRRAPAGDAIRLLDERNRESLGVRGIGCRDQIA